MNFKHFFILWVLFAPYCAEAQIKLSPKGIRYQILERKTVGKPEMAALGDYVSLRIYTTNYKDSLLEKQDLTDVTLDAAVSPIDIRDVVALMAVGDSAVCYIKVDTFARYTGRPLPAFAPVGTDIKHYVRLTKTEKASAQREIDKKLIDDYARLTGLKPIVTASGLQYIVTQQGTGAKPNKGEKIKVHYRGFTLDGKEFDNSFDRGQPFMFKVGMAQVIKGWDEGLMLLNAGSKAILLIPSDLAYGRNGAGGGEIPPNSVLKFEVELLESLSDAKTIADYTKTNNLKTLTTPSGLHYVITQQGTGARPQTGQTVVVHYKGTLLNGQEFDSSFKRNQPFEFKLGMGQVIKGWDEGIALLNVGSKVTLIIPSDLAYGSRGAGASIPPDSVLRFDVELLGVK